MSKETPSDAVQKNIDMTKASARMYFGPGDTWEESTERGAARHSFTSARFRSHCSARVEQKFAIGRWERETATGMFRKEMERFDAESKELREARVKANKEAM